MKTSTSKSFLFFYLGFPYLKKRRLIKNTEYWPREKLAELQDKWLLDLLQFSKKNIPFYRKNVMNGKGTTGYELLKEFPLIDKNTIRKSIDLLVVGPRFRRMRVNTGGSSGQPLVFFSDRFNTPRRERAFMFDQWSRVGYKLGDSIFNLRGRTPMADRFVHHDRLYNIYYASSFELNKINIRKYHDTLNEIAPKFLHGYPSTIYQMALLFDSFGLRLQFRPRAILCGSEKLFHFQREKIETVFGCRAYSWYGHSEYLALGGECEHSEVYHFYPQYGYIELLPTGVRNEKGKKIFELVATGFNNRVMPLIRYRTGDYVVPAENQVCNCGRNYLLIEEVIGREQEFVVDVHGSPISATSLIFGQHFDVFDCLRSIQLFQSKPGEIEIRLVKGMNFRDDLLIKMKEYIDILLGNRMKVFFSFTDEIPVTPIGKAKLVRQELNLKKYFQ